jgi:hypothetical protein
MKKEQKKGTKIYLDGNLVITDWKRVKISPQENLQNKVKKSEKETGSEKNQEIIKCLVEL